MQQQAITYREKTATFEAVFAHLTKCSSNFVPKLDEKVDISTYSKKIVANSVTFEAWIEDKLVGLIAAYFNDPINKIGFITNVSTEKEYSGKGIASQLIKHCIYYGIQHHFKAICLEVFFQNNEAIKLYKKWGFYQRSEERRVGKEC